MASSVRDRANALVDKVGDVLEKMPLARKSSVTAEVLVSHLRDAFARVKDAELHAFLAKCTEKALTAYATKLLKRVAPAPEGSDDEAEAEAADAGGKQRTGLDGILSDLLDLDARAEILQNAAAAAEAIRALPATAQSVRTARSVVGAYQLRWRACGAAAPTALEELLFWDLMLQLEAHAVACTFAAGDKAAPARFAATFTALQSQCHGLTQLSLLARTLYSLHKHGAPKGPWQVISASVDRTLALPATAATTAPSQISCLMLVAALLSKHHPQQPSLGFLRQRLRKTPVPAPLETVIFDVQPNASHHKTCDALATALSLESCATIVDAAVNPSEARRPAAAGDSAGGETQLFFVDTAGDVEPQSQTARNVARLILGVESVPAAEEEENNKDERDEADGDDDDDAASGSSGAVPAVRAAGTNKKKAAVADEADDVEDAQALLKALPELPHETEEMPVAAASGSQSGSEEDEDEDAVVPAPKVAPAAPASQKKQPAKRKAQDEPAAAAAEASDSEEDGAAAAAPAKQRAAPASAKKATPKRQTRGKAAAPAAAEHGDESDGAAEAPAAKPATQKKQPAKRKAAQPKEAEAEADEAAASGKARQGTQKKKAKQQQQEEEEEDEKEAADSVPKSAQKATPKRPRRATRAHPAS